MLSHVKGKQLALQPEVAHSGNSHHMKNEGWGGAGGENPVKRSTEIKLNFCSLSENTSVKHMHAGLNVFFFSNSADALGEAK